MTRLLPALLATLALAAAPPPERRYTVTDFDRVRVDGPFEVVLTAGRPPAASAAAESAALLDRVSLDVQGRTLRLSLKPMAMGSGRGRSDGPVRVTLSAYGLRGLAVLGPASVSLAGARAQRLDLFLSGSGAIAAAGIEADALSLGQLGSGSVTLAGRARTLTATVQGAGDLDAAALAVDQAKLIAETAGEVALNVRTLAEVRANGRGGVRVAGKAACAVSGAGRVACASEE